MTICIGIDVHKKKCVATLKRDSREIVEQTSFYNNSHGIKGFIEHIKSYGALLLCVNLLVTTGLDYMTH
jgi:hypothetical protein